MLEKLSFEQLHKAVKERVESLTNIPCLDKVNDATKAPFYYVEILGTRPENTKTMLCEVFVVQIHAICEMNNSSLPIYRLIDNLSMAMTEDIEIPEPFQLINQTSNGVIKILDEETNESHAVLGFEFKVNYGYKIKM